MEQGKFQCGRCGEWFAKEDIRWVACEGLFCEPCELDMLEAASMVSFS